MATADDELQVRALMGAISTAFINGDVATLRDVFDDDFTVVEPTGVVRGKEEWLRDVSSGDLRIESVESDAFDIRPVGGEAFRVKGQLRMRGHYSKSNYNGTFKYLGLYRKHGDGWKLTLSSARRVNS